jgi:hypothetical protein
MTYYVYKTVNKLNGKIYVGKHRWNGEGKDPRYFGSGAIIKKVIKGVGKENLEVEVLEFSPDEKTNRENEVKWMLQLNSFLPNGYNLKDEATGGLIDKDGKFVTSWELMTPKRREEVKKARTAIMNRDDVKEKISEKSKKAWQRKSQEERDLVNKHRSEGWTEESRKSKSENSKGSKNGMFGKSVFERWVELYGEEKAKELSEKRREKARNLFKDPEKEAHRKLAEKATKDLQRQCPHYKEWNHVRALYQGIKGRFKRGKISEEEYNEKMPLLEKEMKNLYSLIKGEMNERRNNETAL